MSPSIQYCNTTEIIIINFCELAKSILCEEIWIQLLVGDLINCVEFCKIQWNKKINRSNDQK